MSVHRGKDNRKPGQTTKEVVAAALWCWPFFFYNIAGNFVTLITGRLITGGRINEVRLLSFEPHFCNYAMYIGLKKLNNSYGCWALLMAYKLCAK